MIYSKKHITIRRIEMKLNFNYGYSKNFFNEKELEHLKPYIELLVHVSFSSFKTTGLCLKQALCYYFNVIVLSFRLYPITSSQFLRRAISAVRLVSS